MMRLNKMVKSVLALMLTLIMLMMMVMPALTALGNDRHDHEEIVCDKKCAEKGCNYVRQHSDRNEDGYCEYNRCSYSNCETCGGRQYRDDKNNNNCSRTIQVNVILRDSNNKQIERKMVAVACVRNESHKAPDWHEVYIQAAREAADWQNYSLCKSQEHDEGVVSLGSNTDGKFTAKCDLYTAGCQSDQC